MFAGHVHAYERVYPTYNFTRTAGAMTEINIGDGGNREGPATPYLAQPAWSAYREAVFGHGRLELVNATHARWSWYRNVDQPREVGDDVWLVKQRHLGRGIDRGLAHFDYHPNTLGTEWTAGRQHDGMWDTFLSALLPIVVHVLPAVGLVLSALLPMVVHVLPAVGLVLSALLPMVVHVLSAVASFVRTFANSSARSASTMVGGALFVSTFCPW
jgi:hypothetical protein